MMLALALLLSTQEITPSEKAQWVADEATEFCRAVYSEPGDAKAKVDLYITRSDFTNEDRLLFLTVCRMYLYGRVDALREALRP